LVLNRDRGFAGINERRVVGWVSAREPRSCSLRWAVIAALDDTDQVNQLGIAIGGRGAFRRFKDQLSRWPELLERWYAFSEDRQRGRARAWLAAEGYAPAPRQPRL
jgi:hypothetical protein